MEYFYELEYTHYLFYVLNSLKKMLIFPPILEEYEEDLINKTL